MPYELRPTAHFLEELRKLDKSMKILVSKKLKRIRENPKLSKPLEHEANCFSERVKNFRIVFEISGNDIILYRVRKRESAY